MLKKKPQIFTVLKQMTVDKVYNVGDSIELSDKKTIEQLLINKYIK